LATGIKIMQYRANKDLTKAIELLSIKIKIARHESV
jgi:hypothetical protein